jgi:hypothetical protein
MAEESEDMLLALRVRSVLLAAAVGAVEFVDAAWFGTWLWLLS